MEKPEPYIIEITSLGNFDLESIPFNPQGKSLDQILNSPKEYYFFDVKRNGGLYSKEHEFLMKFTYGTLDKLTEHFIALCRTKDLFEDIFILKIEEETKQKMGSELYDELEARVKQRNKRYENRSLTNSSKPF